MRELLISEKKKLFRERKVMLVFVVYVVVVMVVLWFEYSFVLFSCGWYFEKFVVGDVVIVWILECV